MNSGLITTIAALIYNFKIICWNRTHEGYNFSEAELKHILGNDCKYVTEI